MITGIVEEKPNHSRLAVFLFNRFKRETVRVNEVSLRVRGSSLFVRHLVFVFASFW